MKPKKRRPPRPVPLREHMPVVLKRSLPSLKLNGGTLGVIVHVYPTGDSYEVEFFRFDGASVGVATVKASSVSPVRRTVPILTSKQEALLSAITDSKQFTLEAVLARHGPGRPVPELTPGQIAFHGGLTANPKAFSLARVTDIANKLADPKNDHLFTKEAAHKAFAHLKETSIARTLADASAALKSGTLKKLASSPAQVRQPRVRTPHEVLLSVTKPVAEAQVKAYVESHYPGKEQPDFEPLTDAQYAVLEKAAPKARGKVISSIIDTLLNAPRGEGLQLERASQAAPVPPATELHLQIANDFAFRLSHERGQKAVVQHLFNEIGRCSVAKLLGVKKCP